MNIENATAFAQAQSGRNGQRDGSMTAERVALRLSGITKTFPGVIALNGVDFACRAGEVHAARENLPSSKWLPESLFPIPVRSRSAI
jgi:hypothetical protein